MDRPDQIFQRFRPFGGVLAQTALPGRTAAEFLDEAIRFANGSLRGRGTTSRSR